MIHIHDFCPDFMRNMHGARWYAVRRVISPTLRGTL